MRRFQSIGFMIILVIVAVKIMLLEPQKVHLLAAKAKDISFAPVSLSENDVQKSQLRVTPALSLTFEHNHTSTYPLSYHTLAKSGEKIGSGTMGLLTDKSGQGLYTHDGKARISVNPDGSSLIRVDSRYLLLTHMEEAPGAVYATLLKENNALLQAEETAPVDMSGIGGSIIDCAASKTDYGSHLGGEEDYAMNSRYADRASPFYVDCLLDGSGKTTKGVFHYFCHYVEGMRDYLKDPHIDKMNGYNGEMFTPYNYGYIIELHPEENGAVSAAKHYVTGRYAPELALMMPDHKTFYMSDDGNFKGFWKFVSDRPITSFQKVWEGSLYAAKLTQLSDEEGGKFKIGWRELGHASDTEIKALIAKKMKLTDIFDIAVPDENGSCPHAFRKVNEDSALECLRLKPGMHTAAAFLESGKYAAYLGATMEFRKGEGLAYDPVRQQLYFSISAVTKSMLDDYKEEETTNDIRLPKNVCGAVYALSLDENFSAVRMEALVKGQPLKEADPNAEEYRCAPDKISNPDNILYLGQDILIIGEDTRYHVNNFLWVYHIGEKRLTRIASLPIGAEVTGLDKEIVHGKGVLLFNVQHPFADNPEGVDGDTPNEDLIYDATEEQKRAIMGYIDGFPPGFLH